ncbi:MAG: SET domain-containing protein [Chloroflexi bacterium]|nr:SET domain-containing protein [Chloroflexota bacterium]MBI3763434.1 SET domain-containing protein [Chloroflexota bacterium]
MFTIAQSGSAYGARLIATEAISNGALIYRIANYQIVSEPTYQTIQIGPDKHINDLGMLAYLNHSCAPNVVVDTRHLIVVAVRDIAPGEELNYFYPSTEWDMARPFVCLCGAPGCLRLVFGARYLSLDTLSRYFVNEHVRQMALACLETVAVQASNNTVPR